ncbi:hypothetical protein P6166_14235 [Stenotrophomonas sp. HITSZ_GD]|uniref:hypothetical protein n=1 Tax=Stenotrophomonas sp. HITSZ_GD TaxID=3037248 RepID=UPI00240D55F9|nr:hypothetical protein [Stenotrophomonas sp. HITSZ_GD]MDG2526511.1 hypothetical protein [Stenotrophomonas sp. HITSZ_GD]
MKALKSPLAKKVLADAKGREQLRKFLTTGEFKANKPEVVIKVRDDNGHELELTPRFVAKAS